MATRRQRAERRAPTIAPPRLGGCQANVGTYEDEIPCPETAIAKVTVGGEDVWFCAAHAQEFADWRRREDGKLRTINAIERSGRESDAARVRRQTEERLGLR